MPVKRCPMCHLANEGLSWQCGRCGYKFGQSFDTVRGLLHAQLRRSWLAFWVMVVLDLGALGASAYFILHEVVVLPSIGMVLFMIWNTVRAVQKIRISRISLRSIDEQQAPLPKATLRR